MHQKARGEYERALQLTPDDPALLNDMGYSCYSRGLLDEAEKHLGRAVAADPKHRKAWANLALVLGQKGQYQECFDAFCKAVPPAQAHANLAFVFATQGKRQEAKAEYAKALRLEADMPLVREALAKLEGTATAEAAEVRYSRKLQALLGGEAAPEKEAPEKFARPAAAPPEGEASANAPPARLPPMPVIRQGLDTD
jgi:Flp pilus assembly protein TadD